MESEPPQWYIDSEIANVMYIENEYHLGYEDKFPKNEYAIWVTYVEDAYIFYILQNVNGTWRLVKKESDEGVKMNSVCKDMYNQIKMNFIR
jgi:hypothetical protein